ncbi:hypothetical protein QFZ42_003024 [Variovorax paradoxus]|jgi:hypothetical protein|uniref:hypothetical protein n=1 Tax=Variovorax paradoxus TaxID=34073 RepID=UPI002794C758|nr:hypothetical protein [Variovorax paradoxus]MDQ0571190.1 hypothetical protein [Variovorax paradoxus]
MTVSLAASLAHLLLGSELGPSGSAARNRCSFEGISWEPRQEGVLEVGIREFEATALRLASGALVLEIGRVAVHQLAGQVRTEAGIPRLSAAQAVEAELSGVTLQGPLVMPPHLLAMWEALREAGRAASSAGAAPALPIAANAWCLGPLGEAEGTIRGQITDAHLLFDAEVTVPIRQGQVDFNDATVEHVGPDSRMGVSRLGLYVDAPNGRSYLYQFASAPLAGVEFERRGALLSPWVSERGKLHLQDFAEAMLRQGVDGGSQGLTQQARLLLGRTALSGKVQLGDGRMAVPGMQAHMEGSGQGANAVGLRSEALDDGLTVEMASLSVRDAAATWRDLRLSCDTITARLKLQILIDEGARMRFVLHIEDCKIAGPRLGLHRPESA